MPIRRYPLRSALVKDWMTINPIIISPLTNLNEANHLMCVHNARTLPIVDEQNLLIGVITRRDLLRFDSSLDLNIAPNDFFGINDQIVNQIMTTNPLSVKPYDSLKFATKTILENKFNALPVLDELNKLVGMLNTPDIFKFLLHYINELGLSYPINKIMKTNLAVLNPDSSLAEAGEIMFEKKIRSIPILDGSELVGIITRTDLLRAIPSALTDPARINETSVIETTPIRFVMTSRPITVFIDTLVPETAEIMLTNQIHSLPVLDKRNKLVGIITETDLFRLVDEALTS